MNRREAMKKVAVIFGAGMSASTILVFQQGCQSRPDRVPGVFTEQDSDWLNIIGEIIIPETDTPGAAAVNIGAFIVTMLEDCYPEEARTSVTAFLNDDVKGFGDLTMDEQIARIGALDSAVYQEDATDPPVNAEGYKIIKELTLFGYFTSEAGATQALEFVQIPGRWEGCIDLKPGQKAWA